MKIEKIDLPLEITKEFGLEPVYMRKLGSVVLIAGKNGQGKSRFLDLIKKYGEKYPSPETLKNAYSEIDEGEAFILNVNASINHHKDALSKKETVTKDVNRYTREINLWEKGISEAQKTIVNNKEIIRSISNFSFSPDKKDKCIIDFVPKSTSLSDSYSMSPKEVDNNATKLYEKGISYIAGSTIPAIHQIINKYVNVKAGDINISEEEAISIVSNYEKLKTYIKIFLDEELTRDTDGQPVLFGKRIGEAQLSDGQVVLLQFCMALYAQEANLDELIIIMDEPENHLHPAALIEVFNRIIPNIKNGQLWVATHSINVLAHFEPSSIWYMEDGQISYAGDIPDKVLKGLVGNEEEVEKLAHFLSLPEQMAINNFAYESLFNPPVLTTDNDDPQVNQIHELIKSKIDSGENLKVLDFGIGKGRLLSTIYEIDRLKNINTSEWLNYYGFDKYQDHKDECLKVFDVVYGDTSNRYFNSERDVLTKHDECTFDIIIMCNVFHEIDPVNWLPTFTSATNVFKLLKDNGHLLVVEDQLLPRGEKAHSKGFLVFDQLEFKTLFKMTASEIKCDERKEGRLKAHRIPKECLSRITQETKKVAIKNLSENAKAKIKELRSNKNPTFKMGKLHGFWSQQLANSILALEEFSNE